MKYYINYDYINWNKYINAERSNKFLGAKIKREEKEITYYLTKHIKPVSNYPVKLIFTKYVKTTNTDIDNIRVKGLIDGLIESGILINDSLKYINCIELKAEKSKDKTGIDIEIIQNQH